MADDSLWLIAGLGLGAVATGAAVWWMMRRRQPAQPAVRQHVVHRNDDGLIKAVETTTFPGVAVGAGTHDGLDVIVDG